MLLLPSEFLNAPQKKVIRDTLIQIWWQNPSEKVTIDTAKHEFHKHYKLKNISDEDIEQDLNKLEQKGFINKDLFNPRRTKCEYFWLFIIQILLNIFAFTIELANAGAQIKSANGVYYSWDIRFGTFFCGLIFLALYYKKYHVLKKLIKFRFCGWCFNYCPIFLGLKNDEPMQAIPNDSKMEKILSDNPKKSKANFQTQTSFVSNIVQPSSTNNGNLARKFSIDTAVTTPIMKQENDRKTKDVAC